MSSTFASTGKGAPPGTTVGSGAPITDRPARRPGIGGPGPGGSGPGRPAVIGHRGACGYRPEHTCASYELAARLGADYLEPDLVSTRDGVLVARHEPEIGGTTDVARHPEFADRRTVKIIDGRRRHGWFASDFTLAELGRLRAVERLPAVRPANRGYDGWYGIPTFDEILALATRLSEELGREIGVYPETKHPTYHASIGLPLEPPLLLSLRAAGWDRPESPIVVQSFEVGNLRALAPRLPVPLAQLIEAEGAPADFVAAGDPRTYADLLTPEGLAEVAGYAAVLAPDKELVIGPDGVVSGLVADAHAAGLAVHTFTFRAENRFLPPEMRRGADPNALGDGAAEIREFFQVGVDAVFCDQPDIGVAAAAEFAAQTMRSSS